MTITDIEAVSARRERLHDQLVGLQFQHEQLIADARLAQSEWATAVVNGEGTALLADRSRHCRVAADDCAAAIAVVSGQLAEVDGQLAELHAHAELDAQLRAHATAVETFTERSLVVDHGERSGGASACAAARPWRRDADLEFALNEHTADLAESARVHRCRCSIKAPGAVAWPGIRPLKGALGSGGEGAPVRTNASMTNRPVSVKCSATLRKQRSCACWLSSAKKVLNTT